MSGYVLDASVAVAALTEPDSPAAELLSGQDAVFQVPSTFDTEVLGALRGLVRGGKFDRTAAADLIADLVILPAERWHLSPVSLGVLVPAVAGAGQGWWLVVPGDSLSP